MSENAVYSKMFLATITLENDWGYHIEDLWYGSDPKNLASTIMETMNSWYLKNKDKFSPDIVNFYNRLSEAVSAGEDEDPLKAITFDELKGEMFKANGLTMTVFSTNDLVEMFDFVLGQAFEIFAVNGEKAEQFKSVFDLIDYLDETYDVDEQIMNALRDPKEETLMNALYPIDLKYQYTQRHYIPQKMPKSNE